jgi:thiol-disulfide isomerase/thioredoxin
VLLAAAAACSGASQTGEPPIPAVNATTVPGLPTTSNSLPDVSPSQMQELLSRLHGTPVVLNVWGSWCGPCRLEGPLLAAAHRRYRRRVQFLGLDVRDSRGSAQAWIRQMRWTYPSLFDPSPYGSVETQLGFRDQPVTIFYNPDGKIVDQVSGPSRASDLAAGIRKIIGS